MNSINLISYLRNISCLTFGSVKQSSKHLSKTTLGAKSINGLCKIPYKKILKNCDYLIKYSYLSVSMTDVYSKHTTVNQ